MNWVDSPGQYEALFDLSEFNWAGYITQFLTYHQRSAGIPSFFHRGATLVINPIVANFNELHFDLYGYQASGNSIIGWPDTPQVYRFYALNTRVEDLAAPDYKATGLDYVDFALHLGGAPLFIEWDQSAPPLWPNFPPPDRPDALFTPDLSQLANAYIANVPTFIPGDFIALFMMPDSPIEEGGQFEALPSRVLRTTSAQAIAFYS